MEFNDVQWLSKENAAIHSNGSDEYLLVDRELRLIGYDSVPEVKKAPARFSAATKYQALISSERVSAAMEHVLSEGGALDLLATISSPKDAQRRAIVRLRRLTTAEGACVLIIMQSEADGRTAAPKLDSLTGLPDRSALSDRIAHWRSEGAARRNFALLFLDLNRFKGVNDRHGHAAGDMVLTTLSQRWSRSIRDGDLLVRYGGDEFVILIKDASAFVDVEPIVKRLKAATSEPMTVGAGQLNMAVTIGMAFAANLEDVDDLVAAADRDMYSRKGSVRP